MSLLPDEAAERLVSLCRRALGDGLRSVTYFTPDEFDQLYLRDDLERDADLASFIGVEWREAEITQNAYEHTELGEHEYTIRAFSNGYLVRVGTEHDGVFATTDQLSIESFESVADQLRALLDEWQDRD